MHSIRIIPLEELLAGMTLAEDCVDAQGKTLLASGTTITPQILVSLQQEAPALLKVWQEEQSGHENRNRREAELQRTERLFRHAGDSIHAQALRNAVLTYRLQDIEDSACAK
jgi:hypothetical protein